jgi:hypothetical protein
MDTGNHWIQDILNQKNMKTNNLIGIIGLSLLALVACERKNEEVIHTDHAQDKVNVEVQTPNPDENTVINDAKWEQERTEYRHNAELRIEENNKKIDEFNKKIETADQRMRKEYRERIAELKSRNEKAKERLNNYNDNNHEKWEDFKREFNHDMDELGNALKDFTVNNKK